MGTCHAIIKVIQRLLEAKGFQLGNSMFVVTFYQKIALVGLGGMDN